MSSTKTDAFIHSDQNILRISDLSNSALCVAWKTKMKCGQKKKEEKTTKFPNLCITMFLLLDRFLLHSLWQETYFSSWVSSQIFLKLVTYCYVYRRREEETLASFSKTASTR